MIPLVTRLAMVDRLLTRSRRRYLEWCAWRSGAFILSTAGITFLLTESLPISLIAASGITVLSTFWILLSKGWRAFNRANYVAFLNIQFPQLESSAQLIIEEPSAERILQRVQTHKTSQILEQLIDQHHPDLTPRYPIKQSQLACGLIIAVFALLIAFTPFQRWQHWGSKSENDSALIPSKDAMITEVLISAIAPEYTQLANLQQTSLDLTLISGSTVTWLVKATALKEGLVLRFVNGVEHQFERQSDNLYQLTLSVEESQVYNLATGSRPLTKLHSIALTRDQVPKVRITLPQSTITEFSKNVQPYFEAEVQVSDDFAITKVDILASVAKGSGEAVKFRDQVFAFDSSEQRGQIVTLKKSWRASDLGMEPGDELYFTARAWDNKQPKEQFSRSQTKIFRWLDDDQNVIISDGVIVDFMPEYFKSQRQIIIETQQLIADKPLLTEQEFQQTSRSLGHSQSDLKLKYGQYLGDEFDDGSGGHQVEAGSGVPEEHIKDGDHSDDEHVHQEDTPQLAAGKPNKSEPTDEGHKHDIHKPRQSTGDRSGYQQVIAQYGHNHGDTDVGVMGTQSPQALMKRAIANMWDAELHLMLSDPIRALPYEQDALIYLNQAQKAQRIYAQRLGFEPPPVTEKRRYQGDLSDILSYQRQHTYDTTEPLMDDLHVILSMLGRTVSRLENSVSENPSPAVLSDLPPDLSFSALSQEQLESVNRVKLYFNQQAQTRPALMHFVTVLQRIQQAQRLLVQDCESCLQELYAELWRQLPSPVVAAPILPRPTYSFARDDIDKYRQFLKSVSTDGGQ